MFPWDFEGCCVRTVCAAVAQRAVEAVSGVELCCERVCHVSVFGMQRTVRVDRAAIAETILDMVGDEESGLSVA